MNATIKTNDFEIKEMFLEEIEYYSFPLGEFIPPWEETYLLEYDATSFYSVSATSDGGYIISGDAYEGSDNNFLLVKTDALGDVIFYNDYGGSEWDRARHAEQTSDGGYIITGFTYSGLGGSVDVYLVKTDSEGTMLWSKNFGGYDADSGRCVRQTSDGGYIIIGTTRTPGNEYSDCWLIKTDSQGNLIWDKIFYLPDLPDNPKYGNTVQQTADDGYVFPLVTMTYWIWGPVHLIKTDSAGNIEWMTESLGEYGASGGSESIQITSDNSYIVCGGELSFLGYDESYVNNNGFMAKVNSDGTLAWDTKLVSVGTIGYFKSVKQTPDGGYIAVGSQHKSTNIWDLWLVKFDSEGNYKWGKVWDDSDRHEYGNCVEVYNGDYLIAGSKMVFENGWHDCGWLIHEPKITESAPNKPDPPEGRRFIKRNTTYQYTVSTTDPEGDDIRYCIYWGLHGEVYPESYTWTDWVESGEEVTVAYSWEETGVYIIQVLAVDDSNLESEWSDLLPIAVPVRAEFEAVSEYVQLNELIYFNDTSGGFYDIVNWTWNFGDGNVSYEQNTSHIYAADGVYNITLTVTDNQSNTDIYYQIIVVSHLFEPTLWGPLTIKEDIEYTYNASTTSSDENASLYYQFDWGDDSELSDWIGPFASGATCNNATHTWTEQGYYDIKVRAKDESGDISCWSDPLPIVAPFDDDPEPQIGISPSIHNIEDFQLEEISIGELNIGDDVIESVTDVIDDAQYYYGAKIKNIGSTDIEGYLRTIVRYFDQISEQWITLNDPVNDTTPRTINSGKHLALGPIFKGRVHTKALTNGNGNYRVYAVFGDSDGNVLKCTDDTYLVAKCEFTVTGL